MKLLYSNILPLGTENDQETVTECFFKEFEQADHVEIASGYISKASLLELDALVESSGINKIILVIGMYYYDGIAESTYRTALEINKKWKMSGVGEIRITHAFHYHGKTYAFYTGDEVKSAIVGSANLGVIKPEASNRRQYEVSAVTTDRGECTEIATLIAKLATPTCSINIDDWIKPPIIREVNTSLENIHTVNHIPQAEVKLYEKGKTTTSFVIPIKVPAEAERFMDDNKHYTKSNLNVSYAAPRNARKARDWFETQFTVNKSITRQDGYPEKGKPFFVVTDDGYTFKVHTTSDGNKQFSAVGDELILGRWVKGRLAAAGLVKPMNNTLDDTQRLGMITKEMLAAYGCDTLVLTKTIYQKEDENGEILDVWVLSFEAKEKPGTDED